MSAQPPCPGVSQRAVTEFSGGTTGTCPVCEHRLGITPQGTMRMHKTPNERQTARRASYLLHKKRAIMAGQR